MKIKTILLCLALIWGAGCGKLSTAEKVVLIDWTLEDGVRITEGVSSSTLKLADGTYRMYYVGSGGILSATSSDGISFTKEAGMRIDLGASGEADSQQAVNPCVVELADGYRMYYDGFDGTYRRVLSAVSSDGLTFTKEGIRIETKDDAMDNGTASVPDAIRLADGTWLMAYVYDMYGANSIRMATSTNEGNSISTRGSWIQQDIADLGQDAMDPDMIITSDGEIIMFYAQTISTESNGKKGIRLEILSARSADGRLWVKDPGTRILPTYYATNTAGDPDVVETASGQYRMYYYEFKTETSSDIFSAVSP